MDYSREHCGRLHLSPGDNVEVRFYFTGSKILQKPLKNFHDFIVNNFPGIE